MRPALIGKARDAEYSRKCPRNPAYRDGRCDGTNSRGRRLAPAWGSVGYSFDTSRLATYSRLVFLQTCKRHSLREAATLADYRTTMRWCRYFARDGQED